MSWYLCNRGSPVLAPPVTGLCSFIGAIHNSSDAASFPDVTVSPASSWKSPASPRTRVLPYDHSSSVCAWNWMCLSMPCWSQGFYTSVSLKNTGSEVTHEVNRWMTWILRKYLLNNSHPVVMCLVLVIHPCFCPQGSNRVRDWGADTCKFDCIAVPEINVVMEGGRTVGAQRKELRTLLLESGVWEGFLE